MSQRAQTKLAVERDREARRVEAGMLVAAALCARASRAIADGPVQTRVCSLAFDALVPAHG